VRHSAAREGSGAAGQDLISQTGTPVFALHFANWRPSTIAHRLLDCGERIAIRRVLSENWSRWAKSGLIHCNRDSQWIDRLNHLQISACPGDRGLDIHFFRHLKCRLKLRSCFTLATCPSGSDPETDAAFHQQRPHAEFVGDRGSGAIVFLSFRGEAEVGRATESAAYAENDPQGYLYRLRSCDLGTQCLPKA
jgi:hypothetical protein